MTLIGATACIEIIKSYRLLWILGKPGAHKTSLSYMIYKQLFGPQGYRLITNNRCVWGDDFRTVQMDEHNQLHAFVDLDEGGLYFKSNKQVEAIASYAAKMDVVYCFPSFWPPAKAAQVIRIQPVVSLRATGLPIIIYNYRIDQGGFHDKGWFVWTFPQEIYGIYSRQDPGDDPQEIVAWLMQQEEDYRKRSGRKTRAESYIVPEMAETKQEDALRDAADILADAADQLVSVSARTRRRR